MTLRFLHRVARPRIVQRETHILELARGRSVLHLGCVDHGLLEERLGSNDLLHAQLVTVAHHVVGVDLNREGIDRLNALGLGECIVGNAEELQDIPHLKGRTFELVVAGEIIEHVANPGRMLESCRPMLAEHGRICITTPNAVRPQNLAFGVFGFELVHPHHMCWYSPVTLRVALERAGFHLLEMDVYQLPDTPPLRSGRSLSNWLARVAFSVGRRLFIRPLVWFFPTLADGLIAVARPIPRG